MKKGLCPCGLKWFTTENDLSKVPPCSCGRLVSQAGVDRLTRKEWEERKAKAMKRKVILVDKGHLPNVG